MKSYRTLIFVSATSLGLTLLGAVFAGGSDFLTWNTALPGNWNDATKWTPNNVPDAANEVAVIPTGTVTMNVSPTISALQITSLPGTLNLAGNTLGLLGPDPSFNSGFIISNAGNAVINGAFENRADGAIRIQAGTSLTFGGPSLVNNGLITVNFNGGAIGTNITFGSTMTVSGTGAIALNRNSTQAHFISGDGATVTNGAGHTIRGFGRVSASLINNGLITAEQPGNELQLQTNDKTNNGTISSAGGLINISGITVTQSPTGQLLANGGPVNISGSASVVGGILNGVSPSAVVLLSNNTLDSITNSGVLNTLGGSTTTLLGSSILNNGTITVNSNAQSLGTSLNAASSLTLQGTGSIVLNRPTTASHLSSDPNMTITNSSTHTIRGFGRVSASLINNGLVSSTVSGNTLQLNINNKTNNAAMSSTAGTLEISGITITQGGDGQIIADGGAVDIESGAAIIGGTLDGRSPSAINLRGQTALTNIRNLGILNVAGGAATTLDGPGFVNQGTVTVNNNNQSLGTNVIANSNLAISGSGSIVLNRVANQALISSAVGAVVTHGASHTIRGFGRISAEMVNNGLIDASVALNKLELTAGAKTNNAIMRATAGTLEFSSGVAVDQGPNGAIYADGGTVAFNGSTSVSGGKIESRSGSPVNYAGTNSASNLTYEGTVNVAGAAVLNMSGHSIINNGEIRVNSNLQSLTTSVVANSNLSILGTGTINLLRSGTQSQLTAAEGTTITIGADQTVKGIGRLNGNILNLGTILSESVGQTLESVGSGTLTNQNLLTVNAGCSFSSLHGYTQSVGTTTVNGTMTVTGGALQILGGVLKGSGTVVAAIVNDNGGSIEPGASVGRMAITGILTNNSQGIVKMEVGGLTAATEHDQITVGGTGANGAANFDGKIEVDLINGFAPVAGDAATLMTYRFLSGRFQEADIPSLTGIRLRLQYLGTSLRLVALDENALGDANGDGCVDDTDLAAVLAAFGFVGAAMAEDVNDDGFVDDIDLAIVLERFGLGC